MTTSLFIKGLIIGFSIAAPVGPIGILCIKQTLNRGRLAGLLSGLGAATADAVYGCVAGFGLTIISNLLIRQQTWFRLLGGLFLCYLGLKAFFSKPDENTALTQKTGLLRNYAMTFFLTLTNPMTILAFAAIFASQGLSNKRMEYSAAGSLILGVFSGSAVWWLFLSAGVGFIRHKIDVKILQWINRFSGVLILCFGLYALWSLVR
ncbi:MAG: LysE family translocator [Desulfobacteraceae bacterium]|nr:MAG: LysE family translocator [Desulfobacteraceae bacterium]